jgi:ribonuclease P protein component
MKEGVEDKNREEPKAQSWIRSLKREGDQESGKFVFIRYRKDEIQCARLAVIVSRKIGKAVVRNKIKRRLRAISKMSLKETLEPGYYLLIARTGIEKVDFGHLQEEIQGLAERISRS